MGGHVGQRRFSRVGCFARSCQAAVSDGRVWPAVSGGRGGLAVPCGRVGWRMGGLVGQRKGRIGCLGRRRRRVGRKGWIGCLGRSSRACCFGRSCRATDGGAPSGSGGLAGRRMDGPGRLFRVVTSGLLFRAVVSGGEWEGTSGSGRTGLAVSGGRVGWRRMGWAGRLFRAVVPGGCLGWSRLACCFERSWRACCSVRSCRVANGRARRAAEV